MTSPDTERPDYLDLSESLKALLHFRRKAMRLWPGDSPTGIKASLRNMIRERIKAMREWRGR